MRRILQGDTWPVYDPEDGVFDVSDDGVNDVNTRSPGPVS